MKKKVKKPPKVTKPDPSFGKRRTYDPAMAGANTQRMAPANPFERM